MSRIQVQWRVILFGTYPSLLGYWGQRHSAARAEKAKGLAQRHNSCSLAVLGLKLMTFWSVAQSLMCWSSVAVTLRYCSTVVEVILIQCIHAKIH